MLCPLLLSLTTVYTHAEPAHGESPGRYMNPFIAPILLPTTNLFGLPDLQTRELPADATFELTLSSHLANTYINRNSSSENLEIDGEIMQTAIRGRWKLNDLYSLSIYIPYVDQGKGELDNLIYDWHEWFGLPQGGRTETTNNQFQYRYERQGQSLLDKEQSSPGLGDIRLGLQRKLDWLDQSWLAQAEIKAPTGEPDDLNGSGAWDASIGIGWQQEIDSGLGQFSRFAAAGLSYLGESDTRLSMIQKSWSLSARAGFHWHAFSWLTLTAQLDTHSPLFDSDLKPLSRFPMQLTTGGRFSLTDQLQIDLSIGEDLVTVVSPDFVINGAIRYY
ncbi:DUF3187 family protein [Hahella ganghwensis]|uniref:DUF3187 family protein n=1 Tax=Hahella ganghwensis TaxID=286420 RepID=UPI0024800A4D|nr:DUF3187 family protein [Hahella ganghwensis]